MLLPRGDYHNPCSNPEEPGIAEPRPFRVDELPDVATAAEVAHLLRMSRSAVHEAARRGELPSVRVGRRVLFLKEALLAVLRRSVPRPPRPTNRRSRC